jgi:hypothetical protein
MSTEAASIQPPRTALTTRRSAGRTVAMALTALLACVIPIVWGINTAVQLATGTEADHRFHQLTGQGLVLSAVWLSGLIPIITAGWRRRRPDPGVVTQHLCLVATAAVSGVLAPQGGGLFVAGLALVTSALLWWALPVPVTLRNPTDRLDPVAAPLALLGSALLIAYAVAELRLQRTSGDEHALVAHYFDMSWLALTAALALLAGAALGRHRPMLAGAAVLAALAASALAIPAANDAPSLLWNAGAIGISVAILTRTLWRRRTARNSAPVVPPPGPVSETSR